MLISMGVDPEHIFLTVVRDLISRNEHAILVIWCENRFMVCDNFNNLVLDEKKVMDYVPIMSFSSLGTWVHGKPLGL